MELHLSTMQASSAIDCEPTLMVPVICLELCINVDIGIVSMLAHLEEF